MLIARVVYVAALRTLPIDELRKAKTAAEKTKPLGPNERRAVLTLIMLFLAVIPFWANLRTAGQYHLTTMTARSICCSGPVKFQRSFSRHWRGS